MKSKYKYNFKDLRKKSYTNKFLLSTYAGLDKVKANNTVCYVLKAFRQRTLHRYFINQPIESVYPMIC